MKSKSEIVSEIRREWMSWPRKFAVIQKAAERVQLEGGRWKTLIRCARCQQLFNRAGIQCNHIQPVGALASTNLADVLAYKQRMFCPMNLLEPLCATCHRQTTKNQRNTNETNHQ